MNSHSSLKYIEIYLDLSFLKQFAPVQHEALIQSIKTNSREVWIDCWHPEQGSLSLYVISMVLVASNRSHLFIFKNSRGPHVQLASWALPFRVMRFVMYRELLWRREFWMDYNKIGTLCTSHIFLLMFLLASNSIKAGLQNIDKKIAWMSTLEFLATAVF